MDTEGDSAKKTTISSKWKTVHIYFERDRENERERERERERD